MSGRAAAVRRELRDTARGLSGGFLFGIPLLYTMELWQIGQRATAPHLLGMLAITFATVLLLDRTSGYRSHESRAWLDSLRDSTVALALGVVGATLVLLVLGRVHPDALHGTLGTITFGAAPFALGVAIANHFLRGDDEDDGEGADPRPAGWRATARDLGAAAIGALVLAFNIAPTEEVVLLASGATPWQLGLVVLASLLISYEIVFAAGYAKQEHRHAQRGVLQLPWTETLVAYVVSLVAAAAMLAMFGQLALDAPQRSLQELIVLGLPATIGGAAGRLAI